MPPHILFGLGGPALDAFFGNFVYNGLVASGGAACLWRAARGGRERLAWLFLGIGMLSWLGGDLYWTIFLADLDSPPFPSPGDALYLGFYHCCYVALGLLARARLQNIPRSAWLDGAIVGLAVAAVASALVFQPIVDTSTGDAAAVATNLAYPIGDVTLLSLLVAVAAPRSRARPATSCCPRCASASPTCTSTSTASPSWPRRWVSGSGWRRSSSTSWRARPSCTTSARWPSPMRSSASPAR